MNTLEPFEFTKQEEISIDECICEISEVIWQCVASGISGTVEKHVTTLDIISQILGEERSKSFHFAIIGVEKIEGRVVLEINEGAISQNSVSFLENLLQKQVEYFEKNLPQASVLRANVMKFCVGANEDNEISEELTKKMLD
jgi:hypothetical protein